MSVDRSLLTIMAGTIGWILAVAVWAAPTEHPRLVSVDASRCTDCHDDVVDRMATMHAPVLDDCTTCHDMVVGEGGTTVDLLDQEPTLCLMCHDQYQAAADAEVAAPHFPVVDSCLTCHDPHLGRHPSLLLEPTADLCATCHDTEDLEKPHGGQLTEATQCANCHQPHGSDNEHMLLASTLHAPFAESSCKGCHRAPFGDRIRLARRGDKLCTACHGNLRQENSVSVHQAMQGTRARAGCLSCHDPHMSDVASLLHDPGPELCRGCHADTVAAAEADTGHFPAADDCLTCHLPHDSPQPKLLNDPALDLCATCHDTADPDLITTHLSADMTRLHCIGCHSPHGTGHPSLLAQNLHEPILDGCDTCHEGGHNELMDGGESSLCLMCHDDPSEGAEVPHEAIELGRCADCHNPHASAQDHLVKAPGGGPCNDCHDEGVADPGETLHGAIQVVGCRACHEPHGGSRARLLRLETTQLCLGCHDPRAVTVPDGQETVRLLDHFDVPADAVADMVTLRLSADGQRDHPVSGHRVLGMPTEKELERIDTTFEGELDCLSCHNPHKGKSELLLWDAEAPMAACLQCHPMG